MEKDSLRFRESGPLATVVSLLEVGAEAHDSKLPSANRLGTADVEAVTSFLEARTKAHTLPEEGMGDMKMDHSAMKMDHSTMKMGVGEGK